MRKPNFNKALFSRLFDLEAQEFAKPRIVRVHKRQANLRGGRAARCMTDFLPHSGQPPLTRTSSRKCGLFLLPSDAFSLANAADIMKAGRHSVCTNWSRNISRHMREQSSNKLFFQSLYSTKNFFHLSSDLEDDVITSDYTVFQGECQKGIVVNSCPWKPRRAK